MYAFGSNRGKLWFIVINIGSNIWNFLWNLILILIIIYYTSLMLHAHGIFVVQKSKINRNFQNFPGFVYEYLISMP